MFKIIKIPKTIINKIFSVVEKNKLKEKCIDTTFTVNGYQSDNIVKLFNKNLLKKILPIQEFYKKIFHIHYIEYFLNGYQEEHNHINSEKYSFILYLNNSNGDTIFNHPINKRICPELGKLIFFDSSIGHKGEMSTQSKKILVGAVERINNA